MELNFTASVCHTYYLDHLGYFRCSQNMQAVKTEDLPLDGENREGPKTKDQSRGLARWGAILVGLRSGA